jgi:hypothetical protein
MGRLAAKMVVALGRTPSFDASMKRWETIAVFTPLVAGVGFLVWSMISARLEDQAREASAHAAGFSEALEMEAAKKLGISDPVAYRARVEVDQAKIAADNAIRDKNLKAAEAEGEALLRERNRNPADRLTMKAMTWNLGGFRNVGIVNVTIENGNDFAVKDIGIRCHFNGKSGTELSANDHKIFDTIPAKAKRTFKDVNVGLIDSQSAGAGCSVETAQRL